jgi:hypothetical protein
MATTSQDIANEALVDVGWNKVAVTGFAPTFDNSTVGLILQRIYEPCAAAVLRQYPWECGKQIGLALTLSGNVAPLPFSYEYLYPPPCVQFLQLMPSAIADPNDPLPQFWNVGNSQVASVMTKVIWTNVQNARGAYTIYPTEAIWDAGLREAVVKRLGRDLAFALSKPETAAVLSEEAMQELAMGVARVDG